MPPNESILQRWEISEAQLTDLVDRNPSLRGILLGYVAEVKFHDTFLEHPLITEIAKDDDHDRIRKGDRRILYSGASLVIEVKSLQTAMVRKLGNDEWAGKAQVDASDKRTVTFADGSQLQTTLLKRGEFDLLAVNCFAFGNTWRFAFAKNQDLPCSKFRDYSDAHRRQLIASLVPVQWPPIHPFYENPFPLLDEIVASKQERGSSPA